jgi:hypothetical protein
VTTGAGTKLMGGCPVTRSVPPYSLVETPPPEVKPRVGARVNAPGATKKEEPS